MRWTCAAHGAAASAVLMNTAALAQDQPAAELVEPRPDI